MNNAIKAVLFDVDDTLFDRQAAQAMALGLIVAQFPRIFRALDTERVTAAFVESDRLTTMDFEAGAPSAGIRDARSRLFLKLLDIEEDYADAITEIYVRDYPKLNAPVPGAVRLVKELRRKFKVGVVSNGLPDVQYQKLKTLGLRHLLSCIVLSEEIGIRKPDPRIFSLAASRLDVLPGECLYVGDSYSTDILGAGKAGMPVCWLNRKQVKPADEKIPAEFVVGSLEELRKILIKEKEIN